jgi:hypothetical protein
MQREWRRAMAMARVMARVMEMEVKAVMMVMMLVLLVMMMLQRRGGEKREGKKLCFHGASQRKERVVWESQKGARC